MIVVLVAPPLLAGGVWLWLSPWFWWVVYILGIVGAGYGFLWWFAALGKSRWFP